MVTASRYEWSVLIQHRAKTSRVVEGAVRLERVNGGRFERRRGHPAQESCGLALKARPQHPDYMNCLISMRTISSRSSIGKITAAVPSMPASQPRSGSGSKITGEKSPTSLPSAL